MNISFSKNKRLYNYYSFYRNIVKEFIVCFRANVTSLFLLSSRLLFYDRLKMMNKKSIIEPENQKTSLRLDRIYLKHLRKIVFATMFEIMSSGVELMSMVMFCNVRSLLKGFNDSRLRTTNTFEQRDSNRSVLNLMILLEKQMLV
jgi:hypothetical protein